MMCIHAMTISHIYFLGWQPIPAPHSQQSNPQQQVQCDSKEMLTDYWQYPSATQSPQHNGGNNTQVSPNNKVAAAPQQQPTLQSTGQFSPQQSPPHLYPSNQHQGTPYQPLQQQQAANLQQQVAHLQLLQQQLHSEKK